MSEYNIKALNITNSLQKYVSCHERKVLRGRGWSGEVCPQEPFDLSV